MRTEKITEGMLNLQETFVNHSFCVADFMQDQTRRAMTWMNMNPWTNKNGLKIIHDAIDYSKETNAHLQKNLRHGFQQLKNIIAH